jgi:hypothetical protein
MKQVETNMPEEKRQSMLETLRNSYEMYENSKEDTLTNAKKKVDKAGNRVYSDATIADSLSLINTMQKDIKEKYLAYGGKEEDLIPKRKRKKAEREELLKKLEAEDRRDYMMEYARRMAEQRKEEEKGVEPRTSEKSPKRERYSNEETVIKAKAPVVPTVEEYKSTTDEAPEFRKDYNTSGTKANYDTVTLPSKGECYKNKMKEIMVSHLCAYDENMILSPNLYKNGTFLEHILKNKILDGIDPDDLIQGDRDAIIIWLRASGYGNDYPVDMVDEKGNTYRTHVDLSSLKFKKFTLKGDENGHFDFTFPESKDTVKFKFLTNRDVKMLDKMRKDDDNSMKVTDIKDSIETIKDAIAENEFISNSQYEKVTEYLNNIEEELKETFTEEHEALFSHDLTNRLILSTISINGNTDRAYIADYIIHMNVKDAMAYRKYIIENEPGIDYNIKVEKPSSLGGGYVETFLQLDQFIFITGLQ